MIKLGTVLFMVFTIVYWKIATKMFNGPKD